MGQFTYAEYPNMGFIMEFDNGYKISVQWARINYGSNRFKEHPINTATTAEIMVVDALGREQEPIGWLTPDKVLEKMQEIASIRTGRQPSEFDFV